MERAPNTEDVMSKATVFTAGGNMGGDVDVEGNPVIDGACYVEYEGRCVSPPFYSREAAVRAAEHIQHANHMAEGTDEEYSDLDVWKHVMGEVHE